MTRYKKNNPNLGFCKYQEHLSFILATLKVGIWIGMTINFV